MKILFVSTTLEIVNSIILQLAVHLNSKDIEVVILRYASAKRTYPLEGIKIYNFRTLIPPPKVIGRYLREKLAIVEIFLNILRICKKEEIDIIHVFTAFPAGPAASVYKNLTGTPFIITVTGGDVEVVGEVGYGCRLDPVNNKLISYALKSANLVIAPSPYARAFAIEAGARKDRVYVVPYAVDLSKPLFNKPLTKEGEHKLRLKLGVDEKDTIVLSLCRLVSRKGLEYLLRAFSNISKIRENIKLIIAGNGIEEYKLKKIALEQNLMDKVVFLGFVSESVKYDLFKLADIYVLPSLSDAFAMSALEAMGCGAPLIMTEVGLASLLRNGEEYLKVRGRNVQDLTSNLSRLVLDNQLRVKLGKAGRRKAHELNYQKMSDKMISVYSKALSEGNPNVYRRA